MGTLWKDRLISQQCYVSSVDLQCSNMTVLTVCACCGCCRTITLRKDRFDEREDDFYEALYTQSQAQFATYVSTGTVVNNYAHIFDLLIRLRQVHTEHTHSTVSVCLARLVMISLVAKRCGPLLDWVTCLMQAVVIFTNLKRRLSTLVMPYLWLSVHMQRTQQKQSCCAYSVCVPKAGCEPHAVRAVHAPECVTV